MTEIERIADQLRRSHEGNAWHGPSFQELLANVSAKRAAARPKVGNHSIWEVVHHVIAWQQVVVRRLAGETIRELSPEENWPPVPEPTDAAWSRTKADLESSYSTLRQAIARVPEERLNEPVSGKDYSVYVMLHGVIQHGLYHAGKIALLRKG
jgi:uncharacterized damage-inducible protein DinB